MHVRTQAGCYVRPIRKTDPADPADDGIAFVCFRTASGGRLTDAARRQFLVQVNISKYKLVQVKKSAGLLKLRLRPLVSF